MSEKVQESPGIPAAARLPPDMVKLAGVWEFGLSISAVNVNVEPAPQESFAGIILAVAMKLGNSLLNVISVAPEGRTCISNCVFKRGRVASGDG